MMSQVAVDKQARLINILYKWHMIKHRRIPWYIASHDGSICHGGWDKYGSN